MVSPLNGIRGECAYHCVAYYPFSWLLLVICHPVAIATVCVWTALKVANAPGRVSINKDSDHAEVVSGTEPPSGSETHDCQSYQVRSILGKYRLLADNRCAETADTIMNIREFGSIAQIICGLDVSVSLPSVTLCSLRKAAYTDHVSPHTCYMMDCIDIGYRNVNEDGKVSAERINNMRTRLEFDGKILIARNWRMVISEFPSLDIPTYRILVGKGGLAQTKCPLGRLRRI